MKTRFYLTTTQVLRTHGGVAPITKQSGKRRVVVMRRGCNPRLRHALYHMARVAMQRDARFPGFFEIVLNNLSIGQFRQHGFLYCIVERIDVDLHIDYLRESFLDLILDAVRDVMSFGYS